MQMQRIVPKQRWGKMIVLFCGFVFLFSVFISTVAVAHAQEAEDPAPVEEAETSSRCQTSAIPNGIPLEIPLGVSKGNIALDLPDYLGKFFQFVIATIAILAAVKIIIAGFNWTFAAGSQEKIGAAKEDLSSAIWGLLIALLSYSILNIVNPKLVEIPPICPPGIQFAEDGFQSKPCTEQKDCGYTGEFHCVLDNYKLYAASELLLSGYLDLNEVIGVNPKYICSDGRAGDSCMAGLDFTGYDSWCQSGDCNNLTGMCQSSIGSYYGSVCNDASPCSEGFLCIGETSSQFGRTCSDGREGAPCDDWNFRSSDYRPADEYCQSGLTCKDNKCSK